MNTAIIVAAGSGKRFGSDTPKQFLELSGKPVIAHTLLRFQECDAIDEVVVVTAVSEIGRLREIVEQYSISKVSSIVPGGETRAGSVRNGFSYVSPDTEVVAVHDGVRPLVSVRDIESTIRIAGLEGAACLTTEIADTVKRIVDGTIVSTVDRGALRRAMTPQAFKYDVLNRAIEASTRDESVTDESSMVEALGIPVKLVAGDPRNIKITHQEDLWLAEHYLAG